MLKSLVEEGMKVAGWGKTEKDMFQRWLDNFSDGEESYKLSHEINDWLDKNGKNYSHPIMEKIYNLKDMFTKPSIWIIGGDGFAYDIGFAGLDHVLAQDIDINMFIFDNQRYFLFIIQFLIKLVMQIQDSKRAKQLHMEQRPNSLQRVRELKRNHLDWQHYNTAMYM